MDMGGWMDRGGWMDGRIDEWIWVDRGGWVDGRIDEWIWLDGVTDSMDVKDRGNLVCYIQSMGLQTDMT